METAIMEEAKGYEALIMWYHYCLGYCYSLLSMQGWKEGYEVFSIILALSDRITKILETK